MTESVQSNLYEGLLLYKYIIEILRIKIIFINVFFLYCSTSTL